MASATLAGVDERLAALSDRVAAAADAWLSDPQDVQVYGRLVRAILERRAYLNPTLDEQPYQPTIVPEAGEDDQADGVPPAQVQPDELLDEFADHSPVQPLRAALEGTDPRAVLDRLRGA
jgi:hypothetical protein